MNKRFRLFNKVIIILIISDFFLNLGWGLMAPVFAIFIVQRVALGSIAEAATVAGFSSFIFWTIKSILQIPIGRYLDRNHGEIDDFWFMLAGTFMMVFVPIGYLFSSHPIHIYLLQGFYAIAAALMFPSWSAIFTRHIDKDREAFEWGSHSTVLGSAAGVAGGIGGITVAFFGFNFVFIFVSVFTLFATAMLLLVREDISPRDKNTPRVPVEKPAMKP